MSLKAWGRERKGHGKPAPRLLVREAEPPRAAGGQRAAGLPREDTAEARHLCCGAGGGTEASGAPGRGGDGEVGGFGGR